MDALLQFRRRRQLISISWVVVWGLGLLGLFRPMRPSRVSDAAGEGMSTASAAWWLPGLSASPTLTLKPNGWRSPQWEKPSPETPVPPAPPPTERLIIEKPSAEWSDAVKADHPKWKWLNATTRNTIDQLQLAQTRWRQITLHSTGWHQIGHGSLAAYHQRVRGSQLRGWQIGIDPEGHCYAIAQQSSQEQAPPLDGTSHDLDAADIAHLHLVIHGDYQHQRPNRDQITALGELVTYLRLKIGNAPIAFDNEAHWNQFPTRMILEEFNPPQ